MEKPLFREGKRFSGQRMPELYPASAGESEKDLRSESCSGRYAGLCAADRYGTEGKCGEYFIRSVSFMSG